MKALILITIIVFAFLAGCATETSEQITTDCPQGMVNDPYPGSCGQYIDQNNNQICDRSEVDG